MAEMPDSPESAPGVDDFTPSDVVLLRGAEMVLEVPGSLRTSQRFKGQETLDLGFHRGKHRLYEGTAEIPSEQWAVAVISTAFLALEDAGQVRFEDRMAERWIGLSKEPALYAAPSDQGEQERTWPAGSMERSMRTRTSYARRISEIVKDWLDEKHLDPGAAALDLAREGLVSRRFVGEEVEKRLRVLTVRRYHVRSDLKVPPASMATALQAQCQNKSHRVWELLNREARRGLRQLQHRDSGGGGG